MHDAESASLRRAAILLVALSAARWGMGALGERDAMRSTDVLADLAEATAEAAEQGARRSTPLGPGERIDPNRADEVELDRLPGVGPATAKAIVAARDSGRVFRRADDLLVVRGIGPALLGRMSGALDLSAPPVGAGRGGGGRAPGGRGGATAAPVAAPEPVDVNHAGAEDLQRLPGIGPALAERIIAERRTRPFSSIDDLERVPGIGPATVARLRAVATAGPSR